MPDRNSIDQFVSSAAPAFWRETACASADGGVCADAGVEPQVMPAIATILFVTARRSLPTRVRRVLDCAGLTARASVLPPGALPFNVRGKAGRLVLIDADIHSPWNAIAEAVNSAPQSVFVIWCRGIHPAVVRQSLLAGVHGVISARAPLTKASQALLRICAGERQLCFDSGAEPGPDHVVHASGEKMLMLSDGGAVHEASHAAATARIDELLRAAAPQQDPGKADHRYSEYNFDALWMLGENE